MPRDKRYYASLLENTLLKLTSNEGAILRDFKNHLNQVVSSLLGSLSVIASEQLVPKQNPVFSLFIEALNLIPAAGGIIGKAISIGVSQYQEAQVQRLKILLGNLNNSYDIAEIFSTQAIVYHYARILNNELENSKKENIIANIKANAEAIIDKFLPSVRLSPAHEKLVNELLTQLMQGLNSAVDARQQGDLAFENLGDYLAQKLVLVKDEPLTDQFALSGNFKQLTPNERYHIALDAVRLSLLAYEDKSLITLRAAQWGYNVKSPESFFYHFDNGHRCVILANQDIVLCFFRGDLSMSLNTALEAIWNYNNGLGDRLSYHAKFTTHQFIFIGHSFGGALALLAAARFHQQYPQHQNKISVFTFGQPRVEGSLPTELSNKVYRFIHPNDPIPYIFPESLGYKHIGIAYHLADVTGIFDWEDNSTAPISLETNPEARSLITYQTRLLEHARSHSDSALPDHEERATAHESFSNIIFRGNFGTLAFLDQLVLLHSLTDWVITELCKTGGIGFTHPIKNNLARIDILQNKYIEQGKIEHIIECERLRMWLQLAAYQKQDPTSLSKVFKMLGEIQASTIDKNIDLEIHLNTIREKAKAALGDEALAPLVLIDAFIHMSNLPIYVVDKLRHLLSTHSMMHFAVRIRLLELMFRQAQIMQDISSVLLTENSIDLIHWLYQPLPSIAEDNFVKDYLHKILNQLLAIERNNPILQALIAANQSHTGTKAVLLNTLKNISDNQTLTPRMRLYALQIKHAIQLLRHMQSPLTALDDKNEAIDITPNTFLLSYDDHMAMGDLALLANERAWAKSSFIQAYHCSDTPQQTCINQITSLLWQKVNETTEAWPRCLIYQEILRYDTTNQAAIEALFEQGLGDAWGDFERHLRTIGTKINSNEIERYLNEDAVLLQTPFNGTWKLNTNAVQALNNRQPIRDSLHKVAIVGSFHIKENPGAVGLAFAAWALSRWMFLGLPRTGEWGFVPVQPAKVLCKGKPPIVVQLSPTIEGDNLQTLISQNPNPQELSQLDPTHFSALLVNSLLLNIGDARDANLILSDGAIKQITSIDNDHVLGHNEIINGLLKSQPTVKNLVFCLAQMQHNIDEKIVAHLISPGFASLSRIRAWLYCVHYYNQIIDERVFKDKLEHQALFERTNENEQVVLPVFFDTQGVIQPSTKLMTVCSTLRATPEITHQVLFSKVRSKLAAVYEKAFQEDKNKTLRGRMQIIGGLSGVSVSTTRKVIQQNMSKAIKTHKEFTQAQRTPQDVLKLLRDIDTDEHLLNKIVQEISEGDVNTFAREEGMQELVLGKLNEQHYTSAKFTLQTHEALIAGISPAIKRLIFKGNPWLTDNELVILTRKIAQFKSMSLQECDQITGFAKLIDTSYVEMFSYDWLNELCKSGITEISLNNCQNLSPTLLNILPKLWQQYPNINLNFVNLPTTWINDDLAYISVHYPEKGLPIPELHYAKTISSQPKNIFSLTNKNSFKNNDIIILSNGWLATKIHETSSYDNIIQMWDTTNGKIIRTITVDSSTNIKQFIQLLNGWLAILLSSNIIQLWDVNSGTKIKNLRYDSKPIESIFTWPNGWLVIACKDNYFDFLDVNNDEVIKNISASFNHEPMNFIALPNNRILYLDNRSTYLRDISQNESEKLVTDFIDPFTLLLNGWLASRSSGETIKLWDMNRIKEIKTLKEYSSHSINAMTVLYNNWIVTGTDNLIMLWDTGSGQKKILAEVNSPVVFLASAPCGHLISILANGRVQRWSLCEYTLNPNLSKANNKELLLHNAQMLLMRNKLLVDQVKKLFPADLDILDVSNSSINDALLTAILKQCPKVQIKAENCIWLTQEGHELIAQRETKHIKASTLAQWNTNAATSPQTNNHLDKNLKFDFYKFFW